LIDYDNHARPIQDSHFSIFPLSTSVMPADRTQQLLELDSIAAQLLATARKLPRGQDRHELLKEIGRLRTRISELKGQKNASTIM
jgi:hypothetical protein